MLRDFISQSNALQQARLREWSDLARLDALRREARAIRGVRQAVGHSLIALGHRIADHPAPTPEVMDTAA